MLNDRSRGNVISTAFVACWLALAVFDFTIGVQAPFSWAVGALLVLSVAALIHWKRVFAFGFMHRLALVPVLAWGMLIVYADLLVWLPDKLPMKAIFVISPLLTWSSLISSLLVAVMFAAVASVAFGSLALWPNVAAAALTAVWSVMIQASSHLYPLIKGAMLVVLVGAATFVFQRFIIRGAPPLGAQE